MKQIIAIILTVLMLSALFPVSVLAAPADEGIKFASNDIYEVNKPYAEIPLSFEANIYVAKGINGRGGIMLGNCSGAKSTLTFSLQVTGRPRLYYVNNGTVVDIQFEGCDVRSQDGDWVHLAIVIDQSNAQAHCYIDGVLKQTKSHEGLAYITPEVLSVPHRLGGDYRFGNSVPFMRGTIKDVAIYSDIRVAGEIQHDATHGIDKTDANIIAYYNCTANGAYHDIADGSGNGYDIKYRENIGWHTDKAPVTDYEYSFAIVGDTQKLAYKHPTKMDAIYDWILANRASKKIQYVMGLGDITDKNTDAEWTAAKGAISKLNGKIPYSLIGGNHDTSAKFNQYFGSETAYTDNIVECYDDGKIDNTYMIFKVGEVNYLLLNLEYGANDDVLEWAGKVIEEYPYCRVIITTHAYLDSNKEHLISLSGGNTGKNNGKQIWEKLASQYKNVFLVLSGHIQHDDVVYRQDKGVHGNTVTQMLIDPQDMDDLVEGGCGMVCMLYFSEDGQKMSVEWYSTVRNQFYKPENQYEISLAGAFDGTLENLDGDKNDSPNGTGDKDLHNNDDNIVMIIVVSAGSAALIAGGTTAAFVITRKKKNKR